MMMSSTQWARGPLGFELENSPVHGLRADGGPLGFELGGHVSEGRLISLWRLVLELLGRLHGVVVHRLLGAESLLELAVLL